MSISKVISIICDQCSNHFTGVSYEQLSVKEARRAATKAGWKCTRPGTKTYDLCPSCIKGN